MKAKLTNAQKCLLNKVINYYDLHGVTENEQETLNSLKNIVYKL